MDVARRSCSSCSRPAAARAARCLYCGARLPEADEGISLPLSALPAAVDPIEETAGDEEPDFMVMVTVGEGMAASGDEVARLVKGDAFIVTQRLRRGKPFVAAAGLTASEAHLMQGALAREGIVASCFSARMMQALPSPLSVRGGSLQEDAAELRIADGEVVALPYDALFLVVQGEVTERRREVEEREHPLAQVHHGLPNVKMRTVESVGSHASRLVVDLYQSLSLQSYRLVEGEFQAAPAMSPSARQGLLAFVKELRRRAPLEVFDGSFGALDAVDLTPRMRSVRALGLSGKREVTLADNQAELDAYSASLFMHVLRLRRAQKAERRESSTESGPSGGSAKPWP